MTHRNSASPRQCQGRVSPTTTNRSAWHRVVQKGLTLFQKTEPKPLLGVSRAGAHGTEVGEHACHCCLCRAPHCPHPHSRLIRPPRGHHCLRNLRPGTSHGFPASRAAAVSERRSTERGKYL